MKIINRVKEFIHRFSSLTYKLTLIQEALGRIEQRQVERAREGILNSEFRVFSQWGEDGIIQYLIHQVPIERKIFVEFGVENYTQSNTRFLLSNNYWAGLIIDGNQENISYIKKDPIYWGQNLKAECAFITSDNINELIRSNGIEGDIGILSIDIDGNDYWVWKAITCIQPRIVICEYNSLFGPSAKVTVPYDPSFVRDKAHFSKIYYGASISALCDLASQKGYSLVTGNSAGNNVFFVRKDLLGTLKEQNPTDVYRQSCFREYHDIHGNLTFENFDERLKNIQDQNVFNLESKSVCKIKDISNILLKFPN